MRRVSYSSVLAEAVQRATADASADRGLAASMNVFINLWARKFWTKVFWPEWSPVERRQFRDTWSSATTYAAGTTAAAVEVYFPPTDSYYQSLHAANLNNAPATLSGGSYTENSAHWAISTPSYSNSAWAASTIYAVGDNVVNPNDGNPYQCITAHTSTSTFDASKFGILTPFLRNISLTQSGQTEIAEVEGVYDQNPEVITNAVRQKFRLATGGIIARGSVQRPWLRFRKICPSWTGANYSSTTAYVVGDQVYYGTTGDYYTCIQNGTGNAPTVTAFWTRIDFPYALRNMVAQAAYAEWLKGDGQNQKASAEMAVAQGLLNGELDLLERQQGQTRNLPFVSQ